MGYRLLTTFELPVRAQPKQGTQVLGWPGEIVSAWNAPVVADGEEWQLIHSGELVGWVQTAIRAWSPKSQAKDLQAYPTLQELPPPGDQPAFLWVEIYPDIANEPVLTLAVFGDGRMVRPAASGWGWTEQLLTEAGVDLFRSMAAESGLFDGDVAYPPRSGWDAGYATTRISVTGWSGEIVVEATNASDEAEARAIVALGEALVARADTLPRAAVVDADVPLQPYPIPAYNLLVEASDGVLAAWPAEKVQAIRLWLEDATLPLPTPLLETGEVMPGQDLRCSVVDAASAAALREALYAQGLRRTVGEDVVASFTLGWRATNGAVTITLRAVPPGAPADCTRYGATHRGVCVESPDLAALLGVTDPVGCYGSAEFTLEGWLTPIGAYDPVYSVDPGWLCCPRTQLSADGTADPGGLWLVASPDSGVDLFQFGYETGWQKVHVTGHFDDPAAQDCRYTEDYGLLPFEAVIGCRRTFVVTSIAPLAG